MCDNRGALQGSLRCSLNGPIQLGKASSATEKEKKRKEEERKKKKKEKTTTLIYRQTFQTEEILVYIACEVHVFLI